jgi:hypothetical protein
MLFSGLGLCVPEAGMLTVGLVEPDMREDQGRPSYGPILMFPPNFVESATAGIPEVPDSSLPDPSGAWDCASGTCRTTAYDSRVPPPASPLRAAISAPPNLPHSRCR